MVLWMATMVTFFMIFPSLFIFSQQ